MSETEMLTELMIAKLGNITIIAPNRWTANYRVRTGFCLEGEAPTIKEAIRRLYWEYKAYEDQSQWRRIKNGTNNKTV